MGQRLVITVNQYGEDIAKIYYHWSAYSISALQETRDVINVLYDEENEVKDLRLRLIRYCEMNGGGIDGGENSKEWERITKMYPSETFKKNNISRNCGLIALSEEGMDSIQTWSEGDIYINLDENEVVNFVNYSYESIDDYNTECAEWDDDFEAVTLNDIPYINCNLSCFSIDDIEYMIDELESFDGYVCRDNDTIYGLIA